MKRSIEPNRFSDTNLSVAWMQLHFLRASAADLHKTIKASMRTIEASMRAIEESKKLLEETSAAMA